MSEHRDTSLEDLALAIVAALPGPVLDALAGRLAQRPFESTIVDRPTRELHDSPMGERPSSGRVAECHDDAARDRLLEYVAEHGPVSQRQARGAAGVAGRTADAVIRDLEREGLIQNVGTGRTRAWVTCASGSGPTECVRPADTRDTRSDAALNGSDDRAEAVSDSETIAALVDGPCPDQTTCRYRGRHAAGSWSCEFNHPRAAS